MERRSSAVCLGRSFSGRRRWCFICMTIYHCLVLGAAHSKIICLQCINAWGRSGGTIPLILNLRTFTPWLPQSMWTLPDENCWRCRQSNHNHCIDWAIPAAWCAFVTTYRHFCSHSDRRNYGFSKTNSVVTQSAVMLQLTAPLACIRKELVSKLGRDADYRKWGFWCFLLVQPFKFGKL
jgi:hypothetical protein